MTEETWKEPVDKISREQISNYIKLMIDNTNYVYKESCVKLVTVVTLVMLLLS